MRKRIEKICIYANYNTTTTIFFLFFVCDFCSFLLFVWFLAFEEMTEAGCESLCVSIVSQIAFD